MIERKAIALVRAPRDSRLHLSVSMMALLFVTMIGCAPENELGRKAISGTVSVDGTPLETGTISFDPQNPEGTRSGTTISNGQFQIDELKGLPPGDYLVRVSATDGEPSTEPGPPGMSGPPSTEIIPEEWNVNSTQKVTVKSGGENTFTFNIPK